MRSFSILLLIAATVFAGPIPGICDEEANQCLSKLVELTSFDQCGMPPSTAAKDLDPEILQWGLCACPKLVPIFACFEKVQETCPGAKQYISIYGDQVEKGCKIVDWARKQQPKEYQYSFQYFWGPKTPKNYQFWK